MGDDVVAYVQNTLGLPFITQIIVASSVGVRHQIKHAQWNPHRIDKIEGRIEEPAGKCG